MPYKIDYVDGAILRWSLTADGATATRDDSYAPTFYVSAHGAGSLTEVRSPLREHPAVERTSIEEARISFRHDPGPVLRVDVDGLDAVRSLARTVSGLGDPGTYRCYDVDFGREFRYCLEAGVDPCPGRAPRVLDVAVPESELVDPPVTELVVGDEGGDSVGGTSAAGDTVGGDPESVLVDLAGRLDAVDPDVLRVNTAEVIPALYRQADRLGVEGFELGRRPGWQELAGESTYTSYGRVDHSPARYNLPGRVVVDESNTFFWDQTNLHGCLDLVERSGKPLQELSWSSIGSVLTAIQIREARDRGVLVPWRSWRHERFKTMGQLRDADRGGFTFSSAVGVHEDVHELDFSSLYPNVIVTRNVSPETVRCECHADRGDVPGLGYAICDDRGYLPEVLESLVADRDRLKAELAAATDPDRIADLEGRSNAIKWILVSCFGYQGFSNAKFGRIECHEAINAFAREILLDAKELLEAGGWRVLHGIVDSLWVTPAGGESQTPLPELVERVTGAVGIRLEYEASYDWLAFVPLRGSEAGALTKYFGRVADEGAGVATGDERGTTEAEYKYRGIECRQRSTPAFVAEAQRDLVAALDERRDPEYVCGRLRSWIDRLRRGDVDVSRLLVENRVAKSREEYSRYTRNVAALERAEALGLSRGPGRTVSYVVVDDGKRSRDRVALAAEDPDGFDAEFYRERLLRAAESVLSPLGWRRGDVERELDDRTDLSIQAFADR
jgi:DNA polymerase I